MPYSDAVVFIPKKDGTSGLFPTALALLALAALCGWLAVVFFQIADGDLFSWFPFGRSLHLPGFVIVAFFGLLATVLTGLVGVIIFIGISDARTDRKRHRQR